MKVHRLMRETEMKNILFFDTETTGFVKNYLVTKDNFDANPRMVQIGYVVASEDGEEIHRHEDTIKPDGFEIPDRVAEDVHGITTQIAQDSGIDIKFALFNFYMALLNCDLIVAHNLRFDVAIVRSELCRLASVGDDFSKFAGLILDVFYRKPQLCTMLESKSLVNAVDRNGRPKRPKLTELHEFLFPGEDVHQDHTALSDALILSRCYFKLNGG